MGVGFPTGEIVELNRRCITAPIWGFFCVYRSKAAMNAPTEAEIQAARAVLAGEMGFVRQMMSRSEVAELLDICRDTLRRAFSARGLRLIGGAM